MRLSLITATALVFSVLPCFADTMIDFSIHGYGTVYMPTSPRRGHTFSDTASGEAIYDVDTQTFTKFELSTYEGTTDYPGTALNGDPCGPDAFYSCLGVYGDAENGFSFDFYDQENLVFFKHGYGRVEEQYFGDLTPVSSTPEPSSLLLLSTGLLGAFSLLRKKHLAWRL